MDEENPDEDNKTQKCDVSRYDCTELLELLSFYEGELQAKDALIETLQQQQQCSHSNITSKSITTIAPTNNSIDSVFDALFRDSFLIDGEHASHCASCGNKLLHTAKMLQIQRDCDRKLIKALGLMNKRHAKVAHEQDMKEMRIHALKKEDEKYVNKLESERDELLEQLKQQQIEFAEMVECKSMAQDQLKEQSEREKLIVLFLMRERNALFEQLQETERLLQEASSPAIRDSASSSICSNQTEVNQQIRSLQEENRRLHNLVTSLQDEKTSLQKKLDYFMKDLQQSAFHQQFQFLQPKSSAEKELIVIGNGLIPAGSFMESSNRIRNSSSFPQSFGGNGATTIESSPAAARKSTNHSSRMMPQQFPVGHFEKRHSQSHRGNSGDDRGGTSTIVPLNASNSTMIMRKPPPVPRTSAAHPNMPQQHFNRRQINDQPNTSTSTTIVSLGMPQTSITRRSTSLPRRIIIAPNALQSSFTSKQQQNNRRGPASTEPIFYQQSHGSPMEDANHQHNKFVHNLI